MGSSHDHHHHSSGRENLYFQGHMPNDMEDHLLTVLSVASGVPKEEISRDSRMEDLAFDSLVVSELSLKLRKEFGVTGVDDELDLLETVDELFQLVEKHRAAGS
nr:Chain A, Specialized acyl carrier protein [Pseudomonas aeruginosa 2192]